MTFHLCDWLLECSFCNYHKDTYTTLKATKCLLFVKVFQAIWDDLNNDLLTALLQMSKTRDEAYCVECHLSCISHRHYTFHPLTCTTSRHVDVLSIPPGTSIFFSKSLKGNICFTEHWFSWLYSCSMASTLCFTDLNLWLTCIYFTPKHIYVEVCQNVVILNHTYNQVRLDDV